MRIVLLDDAWTVLETISPGWPDADDKTDLYNIFEAVKPLLYAPEFGSVDCVILDLQLPDASGSQVLTEIRRISDVPIIMLSGWGDTDFRAELINRGIDDYVLKPTSARELHARARRLVHRARPASGQTAGHSVSAASFTCRSNKVCGTGKSRQRLPMPRQSYLMHCWPPQAGRSAAMISTCRPLPAHIATERKSSRPI